MIFHDKTTYLHTNTRCWTPKDLIADPCSSLWLLLQRGDPTCSLAASLKLLGETERGGPLALSLGLGSGLGQREPYPPGRPRLVPNWPQHGPPPLGQVAGVAVALNGFPVVFHRGARVFDEK